MAEFYPTNVIRLLKNVPLDNTYSDVIKFSSLAEQQNYFISKTKHVFSNLSIQRVNYSVAPQDRPPLSCTVPINAETIYDCNYIMFQNSNYGNKWFYAFITNIGYVSPNVSKIFYNIDDFQTWQFDFTIGPSYVEREHTNDDTIGNNLVPEPIKVSEYLVNTSSVGPEYNVESFSAAKSFVLYTTQSIETGETRAAPIYLGNFLSGTYAYQYSGEKAASNVCAAINNIENQDIILCVQAIPVADPLNLGPPILTHTAPSRPNAIINHEVANNKLLTYPFIKLMQQNSDGQVNEFKYEFFSNPNAIQFKSICTALPTAGVLTYPLNYENVQNNFSYATTLMNFPIASTATDVYKAWLSQNLASIQASRDATISGQISQTLGGVLTALGGAALFATGVGAVAGVPAMLAGGGMVASAGITARSQLNSIDAEIADMQNKPNTAKSSGSGNITYYTGDYGNYYYSMCITENEAKRIDSFFTRYGYQTNEVKEPNLTGRENFNYVKLKNPYITGSIPVESMANIKTMFTNGIRLWHNAANYMNFSLSNKIVGENNA